MSRKRGGMDMTVGKPTRLLIMFALPMMFGAVFDLMYNMVTLSCWAGLSARKLLRPWKQKALASEG